MLTSNSIAKGAVAGFVAALVMFIPMIYLVNVAGVAPFNMPPSAAFAQALGIDVAPFVAPALHFLYGIAAGLVYVLLFRSNLSPGNAFILAGGMWLILMLVFSPIVGWGFFGFGDAQALPASDPMHLGPPAQFILVTLGFHILFAVVMGLTARGMIGRRALQPA